MNTDIQPLLITPRPKSAESLQGFILRTSEANGYDSPTRILRHVGMDSVEAHSARPSLDKLAALYGRDADSLRGLGCIPAPGVRQKKGKYQTIMGHTLPVRFFIYKYHRVCPECVLEQGTIESYWELRYAVACPIHGRYGVAVCPACNRHLDWLRRGLLRCSCGQDLSKLRGKALRRRGMLALLGLIRSKLRREPLDKTRLDAAGFPVEAMEHISLETLLGIVDRFEHSVRHLEAYKDMPGVTGETIGLRGAEDILSDWPRGLHSYLMRTHLDRKSQGLRQRHDSFYETFFKSGLPADEIEFLQKGFMEFGQQRWGVADTEKSLGTKQADEARPVADDAVAQTQNPLIESDGASWSLKGASVRVGLPPGVLKLLRQSGTYQARYRTSPEDAFHERDLDRFRGELIGNAQEIPKPCSVKHVSLSEVMHMPLGNQKIKADVVAAVYGGTLKPIGRIGDSPGRLILIRAQVVEFLRGSKERNSGLVSTMEAAKRLVCAPEVVRKLALDGVLEHMEKPVGIFVRQESLDRFSAQYVSCMAIARANGCGVRRIMNLCEVAGVRLIRYERSNGGSAQPFINREQLGLLGF